MTSPALSFATFYDSAKDRVFRSVLAATKDSVRAEDAVAEAFLRAYERWESVSRMTNPTAWAIRVALNSYRSGWRVWHREVADPAPMQTENGEYPSDDTIIHLVRSLPPRQREVVALRILADLSERDVASTLGIAPKTVSVHLYRALETLRVSLQRQQKEEQRWTTQDLPAK